MPTCPICYQPAHASETDDLDRHPACERSDRADFRAYCATLTDTQVRNVADKERAAALTNPLRASHAEEAIAECTKRGIDTYADTL